jgi:hypothetical protein
MSAALAIARTRAKYRHLHPVAPARLAPLDWALAHATLRTPHRGVLRFADVARDYQRTLLADQSPRRIVVKSRQIGISQAVAFECACEALNGGTAVVVSRNGEQASLFLRYVYAAIAACPHPPFTAENARSLMLANGGMVVTQGATKGAGRGIPATLLVLDEFAWAEYDDDIYTATMPVLANGGRVIVLSTPNGRANKFAQLWMGGEGWSRHELPWHVHPDWRGDPDWRATKLDEIGAEAFAQEYDCDFITSGLAVFDTADIAALWQLPGPAAPVAGHRHVTAWDIARKADAFVGVTLDVSANPFRLVAFERHQRLPYPQQVAQIEARHRTYPGRTVVESNGVGDPVIQFLSCRVEEFTTTVKTKKDAIDAAKLLMERRELVSFPIPQLDRELSLYERDDKALVQDCVMALAMAALHAGRPAAVVTAY